MGKRRQEPRYVALVARETGGLYYRFPDLPGFILDASGIISGQGYFEALEMFQSHLDDLKSQGLSVPTPSLVREVMAVPANRVAHRIFDLGELRTIKRIQGDLLASRQALNEADAATVRRYLAAFDGDRFVDEIEFEKAPGLSRLQEIFGCSVLDFMIGCFPINADQARALGPFLGSPLQLGRYEYFLEACDRQNEAPTQET